MHLEDCSIFLSFSWIDPPDRVILIEDNNLLITDEQEIINTLNESLSI